MTYAPRNDLNARLDAASERVIRPLVRELLERSPAFRALGADRQHALAADMVSVTAYLAEPARLASQANNLLQAVDFPAFVAGLINGVFDAVVSASVKQMEAYGDLLKAVLDSIDTFVKNNVTDDQARDYLTKTYPDLVPPRQDSADTTEPPPHRQLVGAMMAVGIGRVMSTA
jgi:hypothetical protein